LKLVEDQRDPETLFMSKSFSLSSSETISTLSLLLHLSDTLAIEVYLNASNALRYSSNLPAISLWLEMNALKVLESSSANPLKLAP
jgi:hypothetical protein